MEGKQLYRSQTDRMIGGVCGGLSEYFGWDSSLVRLTFICIIFLAGSGIVAYILLWVIIPESSSSSIETTQKASLKVEKPQSLTGIILVSAGILLLLHNLGLADIIQLNRTWPVILIIIGFLILKK